jgi:hypothetical protein
MIATRLLALLLPLGTLAACGGEQSAGPERKTAAGEVLGGTVSDAMLPLDTVRSQSPPLAPSGDDAGYTAETASDRPARRQSERTEATAEPTAAPTPSETPETTE